VKFRADAFDFAEIMSTKESLNSNIVTVAEQQHNGQVAALNAKVHNNSSKIKELKRKLEVM
jgi:hypothetical protein